MNRGAARQPVFLTARDGESFESLLGVCCQRFGVEVHAYCLMPNHYHLLLHCPEGGLSAFMQLLGARYTRSVNDRLGRDGPIFRGRFRSIVIDSDSYLAAAGRYIHRNPIDLRPHVDLAGYRWSSYRCYLHPPARPSWLRLDALGGGSHPFEYRAMVEGDVSRPAASVAWAISVATAEVLDDPMPGALDRTVGAAMVDAVDGRSAAEILDWLRFPTTSAQRSALLRAQRRMQTDEALARIVERACDLLSKSCANCV